MATSLDDNTIRKTIYGKWFAGKRYIDLLLVRKTSTPLSFAARLVCSFVYWLDRQKPGEAKPLSVIAERLHMGRGTVSQAADDLQEQGLVTKTKGRANAALLLPTHKKLDEYFAVKSGRLLSNRLYLLADDAKITVRDAVVLSVLHSLAVARKTIFITNRKTGLAKLASISRSQVDLSLGRLKKAGAVVFGSNHLALKQPTEELLKNFRDTGKRKAAIKAGQLFSVTAKAPAGAGYAEFVNRYTDKYQEEQLAAGWTPKDCNDYWAEMLLGRGLSHEAGQDFLLLHFPVLWITAQEQHAETGQAKTCRHLLASLSKQTIEDLIRERRTL